MILLSRTTDRVWYLRFDAGHRRWALWCEHTRLLLNTPEPEHVYPPSHVIDRVMHEVEACP